MRSEPVLQRALALAAPVNPIDFPASIDLRQKVLAFFGSRPAPIMTDAQILKAARPNVTINRRGLTPVIAISVRSASPAFAARFANAIALAHIDEEGLAKAEAVAEAGRLVEAQVSAIEVAIADIERDHQLVLSSGSEVGIASSLETLQRQRHILQLRADDLALQASLQLPDSRLAAPASVPVDASFPDLRTTSLIAALFAATIAMGATIAVDGWADGMRSTTELAALVGGPIAIAMPKLKARRLDGTCHADQVVKAPLSPLSQAMRSLQVSLSRSFAESASPVIAVMSAAEGEGKTTTALGMARAFAMTGQRVLLIDADMRSPALSQHLDVESSHGLDAVLSGGASLADLPLLMRRDPMSSLNVLVNSGPNTLPAGMLFGGAAFSALLQGARASFDVTVLDMPAFRWRADVDHVLAHVDNVVLVAGWGRAERSVLEDMLAAIRAAKAERVLPIQPVLSMQPQVANWSAPFRQLSYMAR